jgi:4-hydroxy-3-polyprenylbenzoate decarboxylase
VYDIPAYFTHVLERADWRRDLHFQTSTTIDTLDYSGTGLNRGSKLVVAAAGGPRRTLARALDERLRLPDGFKRPALALPGVVLISAPARPDTEACAKDALALADYLGKTGCPDDIALVVLTEDSEFAARHINNFLWITFTRSNPSHDVYGVNSFTDHKHWGCKGPLIIDARLKPHHAPPLIESPRVSRRVDQLGVKGGSLHGII